jgi:REP element-mobilizing transposase RayT
MHIEYPPKLALSDLVKRLKGRTSRLLQAGKMSIQNISYRGGEKYGDGKRVTADTEPIFRKRCQ